MIGLVIGTRYLVGGRQGDSLDRSFYRAERISAGWRGEDFAEQNEFRGKGCFYRAKPIWESAVNAVAELLSW